MIGEKNKEETLFYYLRPEELIPQDHILRLIHQHVDFTFIRSKVEHLYSHTGRPSVDPEVMMRMLLELRGQACLLAILGFQPSRITACMQLESNPER